MGEKTINKNKFIKTDLLPFEVPLIFSNNNLYKYLENLNEFKVGKWKELSIDHLYERNKIQDTEPYNYLIYKNDSSQRMLSLIHPLAQLNKLKFIEKYDLEIINFFKQKSMFSIRYPYQISNKKIKPSDTISKELLALLDEDKDEFTTYPSSYFDKRRFTRINDFFNSNYLRNLEIKYSHLLRIDFQACFYNIYTHSLDWSYLGDIKLAKESRNKKRLSSILDRVLQASNFGETNGLVVGPEFSRYASEIVLCNIDNIVYNELKGKNLKYKIDYEIVRFMDDIFIFCNDKTVAYNVKKTIEENSLRYRLSINETKSTLECRPFLKDNLWESRLRSTLVQFYSSVVDFKSGKYTIIKNMFRELTDEIKTLLIEFGKDQHKIIGFTLKFFENKLSSLLNNLDSKEASIRSYFMLILIDFLQYILIFSINNSNIIKYIKLSFYLLLSNEGKDEGIVDLLYKKAFEVLKYHSKKRIEVLNLIVSLKFFPKNLPESILLKFIEENKDYFSIASISFYIDNDERKYMYKKVRKTINITIKDLAQDLIEENKDEKSIDEILFSKNFYMIHDFYSSNVLFKETRKKIELIKKIVDKKNINWEEKSTVKFFNDFIKGFNKPFMNWDSDLKDIVETLERQSSKLDTTTSG